MIDRDRGARALVARLRKGLTVHVGVVGPRADAMHTEAKMPVGQLAAIHEFGIGVPERSFVRATIDQEESRAKGLLRRTGERIWRAIAPKQAARQLGEQMARAMVATIEANIPPPLSEVTIARKGHDLALVDTGQLIAAVGYTVEVDNGK